MTGRNPPVSPFFKGGASKLEQRNDQKVARFSLQPHHIIPPLKKGGRGDFHSHARLLFVLAVTLFWTPNPSLAAFCLTIETSAGKRYVTLTNPTDQFIVRFKHSIYGSTVEEIFTVREQGLELTQLRYSEARLVEFYGHERARKENGLWIVAPDPVHLPALNLGVSQDARMNLSLLSATRSTQFQLPPGGASRVAVAACETVSND